MRHGFDTFSNAATKQCFLPFTKANCHLFMKPILQIVLLFFALHLFASNSFAQQGNLSRLKAKLSQLEQKENHQKDTVWINTVNQLAFIYADAYPDSALLLLKNHAAFCHEAGCLLGEIEVYKIIGNAWQTKGNFDFSLEYYAKAEELAKKTKNERAIPGILNNVGLIYVNQGNYPLALQKFYETLKASEAVNDKFVIGSTHNNIAIVYFFQGKMDDAINSYNKSLDIAKEIGDTAGIILAYSNIGEAKMEQHKTSESLTNLYMAYEMAMQNNKPEMQVAASNTLANAYMQLDSAPKAIFFFNKALTLSKEQNNTIAVCKSLLGLAKLHQKQNQPKEALANAQEALAVAKQMGHAQLQRDTYELIANLYESLGDGMNALKHFKQYKFFSDSINNLAGERAASTFKAGYELSKQQQEFERKTLQQRWIIFSAFAALFSLGIIVWVVNRNKKRLGVANKHLHHKNKQIEAQKIEAEETLAKLKDTQAQLVQSEKMASLGELTAGIAHEIQNPLNFVNNFGEVSNELMDEMKEHLEKGNYADANEIANDVKQNLEKITHHGKRAGDIVKGMLQHSRSSSATKESTDINKLADEYLRLAYHGLRAKDKTFNATLTTDFDESIGNITIIPQDIGRVILNLITNAFYATGERKKAEGGSYEPTVSVTTKKMAAKVLISVKDNGNGIPQKVLDKIFQPFFTTKPTGQGTGLGLSLSYDIVKAHGGELKVETKEGEGSEFIIQLPA